MKKYYFLSTLLVGFTAPLLQGCKDDTSDTPPAKPPLTVHDNVVVVDSTTHHLDRTPALLAAGTYRFTDTGGALSAPVGSVIVGEQGLGFLRKVTAASTQGNLTTLQTEPASLDDLFSGGTLTLRSSSDSLRQRGTAAGFTYNIGNRTVYQDGPLTLSLQSGSVSMDPNWTIEAGFGPNGTLNAEVAARNASLDGNFVFNVTAAQAATLVDRSSRLTHYFKDFKARVPVVILGVPVQVPVMVRMNVDLDLQYSATVSAAIERNVTFTSENTFDLGMAYKNGSWQGIYSLTPTNSLRLGNRSGQANANVKMALIPKISFQLYGAVGPYASVGLQEELQAAVASPALDWNFQADAWLRSTVGVTGKVFGKQLPDYNKSWETSKLTYTSPARLERTAGDAQTGPANQALPNSLKVRVLDSNGDPQSSVPVYFTPATNNGSASPSSVLSDADGYAQTTWTLGSATGSQRLTATAKLANGQAIANAPVDFQAVVTQSTSCLPAAQMQLLTGGSSKTWRLVRRVEYSASGAQTGTTSPAPGVTIRATYRSDSQYTYDPFTTDLVGNVDSFVLTSSNPVTESFCSTNPAAQIKFMGYSAFAIDELTTTSFVLRELAGSNKYVKLVFAPL